jgi:hypothetical protein
MPRSRRVIAQAVIRRLLTAVARARAQVSPYRICGGQSGSGTKWQWDRFFSESFSFPCQHHSTADPLHSWIIWGMDNVPVSGRISTET